MNPTHTSPIDPAALAPVLAPIGQSRTLPAEAYTSPEVLAWELRHFFEGSWVCVGRSAILPHGGDHTAIEIGGEGVLLVRGEDGTLRGFANACRHRGHELVACGAVANERVIKCPYHAWVYGLDGSLRAAPRFSDLPGTDPVFEGLVRARVEEWRGWIFANADACAPPLAEHVGNLDELLAPYDPASLVTAASHEYEVRANWKIVVENYHECYHCPQIHPELCRVTPPTSGDSMETTGLWVGGSMDLREHAETMSISGASGGAVIPGLPEHQRRQVFYFGLFPNLLVSPHPDYVLTHRIEPLAIDRTRIQCEWLFPRASSGRPGFDPGYAVEFWDITNRQDWGACESVQRGVSSRGYRPGPLALEEDNVHQFLTMVAGGYLQGSPVHPVPAARFSAAARS